MTVIQSHSPADHQFAPRRLPFDIETTLATDWHGGDAFRSAYFNALSTMFPIGEKFFIDSVRHFRNDIDDPRLRHEIAAFQGQEAIHRLEHQRYNEMLCEQRGYDLERIESPIRRRLAWAERELSPLRRLAGTVAYEHITAVMADDMLRHADVLQQAEPHIADLWRWHGIEETEHKSVAFDVYVAVGGQPAMRKTALLMNSWFFFKDVFRIVWYMLKTDGRQWQPRVWLSGLNFLLGRPGILWRGLFRYASFYRSSFHPWDHDNRELLKKWLDKQAATGQP